MFMKKGWKECAILCNGAFPVNEQVLTGLLASDMVVCCDGAVENLFPYREPDYIVGDLDSISALMREKFSDRVIHISEQQTNDLSKCFRFVCSLIVESAPDPNFFITVYGATGKREDHTLANISLLADFNKVLLDMGYTGRIALVTDEGTFFPLYGSASFNVCAGIPVSLFAFDRDLRIKSTGLEYPTDSVVFDMWWKATLNRTNSCTLSLEFDKNGKALIYFASFFVNIREIITFARE